jgi:hypothetical protein
MESSVDELQTIDKIEKDFNRVADMAYEEYCSKMILMAAMEDILKDGTCTASIREIAEYAVGLVNDKK